MKAFALRIKGEDADFKSKLEKDFHAFLRTLSICELEAMGSLLGVAILGPTSDLSPNENGAEKIINERQDNSNVLAAAKSGKAGRLLWPFPIINRELQIKLGITIQHNYEQSDDILADPLSRMYHGGIKGAKKAAVDFDKRLVLMRRRGLTDSPQIGIKAVVARQGPFDYHIATGIMRRWKEIKATDIRGVVYDPLP